MLSPPSSRIIALLVTVSFLPGSRVPAQETAKQKPDYSQEAVVIERVTNTYFFAQSAVALDNDPDAAEALRRLARKAAIPSLLRAAREDLRLYNIFAVGQLVPNLRSPVEAEVFLVYAPDPSRNAQALDVKFIKGDERLRPLAAQLKTIKYQLVFPENSPTRIIRRGALLCLPKPAACTFTMTSPELVKSVD